MIGSWTEPNQQINFYGLALALLIEGDSIAFFTP